MRTTNDPAGASSAGSTPSPADDGTQPGGARIFISYSHAEPDEVALAAGLHSGLTGAGCDVFIDTAMLIGTDWVAEIDRRIQWCDYLVVLLSERAVSSEMVQSELRLARNARRTRGGRPHVLPIRVRYRGPLDYELEGYLGRLHYTIWGSADDTETVLRQVLLATRGGQLPETAPPAAPAPRPPTARPLPRIDPRRLTVEGGALPSDEPLYVARAADAIVEDLAAQSGQTIIIKAPKQMGKSSLLIRYLAACQRASPPKTVACVDLSMLSQDDLATYATFLSQLAAALLQALDLESPETLVIPSQAKMTWFVEDRILTRVKGPLVLAFDAVDRVLGRPFQADFFTMLRMWHNNKALKPVWRLVDRVLVISTEPYLLINDDHRSIFNVGRTLTLEPLTLEDYRALNEACAAPLDERQLAGLWDLLHGQPYLTRVAFYWLASDARVTYEDLIARAADERGPFGEHLRAMLMRLHGRPELLDSLRAILRTGTARDDETYHRLVATGVVRREGARIEPANRLYAEFFGALLP